MQTTTEPETPLDRDLVNGTGLNNPLAAMTIMLQNGADPVVMGQMMGLCERWEANQAAKAYGDALAAFQAECPIVVKVRDVMNKDKTTLRYKFAGYDDVMKVAGPVLARHRISVSFSTPTTAERFEMVMRIQVGSHFQDKPYSAPLANLEKLCAAMYVTEPQAWGLCLSYHKRYCFCNGLNMVVSDTDSGNDMQESIDLLSAAELDWIKASFAAYDKLTAKAKAAGRPAVGPLIWNRFLDWLKVEKIEDASSVSFAPLARRRCKIGMRSLDTASDGEDATRMPEFCCVARFMLELPQWHEPGTTSGSDSDARCASGSGSQHLRWTSRENNDLY